MNQFIVENINNVMSYDEKRLDSHHINQLWNTLDDNMNMNFTKAKRKVGVIRSLKEILKYLDEHDDSPNAIVLKVDEPIGSQRGVFIRSEKFHEQWKPSLIKKKSSSLHIYDLLQENDSELTKIVKEIIEEYIKKVEDPDHILYGFFPSSVDLSKGEELLLKRCGPSFRDIIFASDREVLIFRYIVIHPHEIVNQNLEISHWMPLVRLLSIYNSSIDFFEGEFVRLPHSDKAEIVFRLLISCQTFFIDNNKGVIRDWVNEFSMQDPKVKALVLKKIHKHVRKNGSTNSYIYSFFRSYLGKRNYSYVDVIKYLDISFSSLKSEESLTVGIKQSTIHQVITLHSVLSHDEKLMVLSYLFSGIENKIKMSSKICEDYKDFMRKNGVLSKNMAISSLIEDEIDDTKKSTVTRWVIDDVSHWKQDEVMINVETILNEFVNCVDIVIDLPSKQQSMELVIIKAIRIFKLIHDRLINIQSMSGYIVITNKRDYALDTIMDSESKLDTPDPDIQRRLSASVSEKEGLLYMASHSVLKPQSVFNIDYKDTKETRNYNMRPVFRIEDPNPLKKHYLKQLLHLSVLDIYSYDNSTKKLTLSQSNDFFKVESSKEVPSSINVFIDSVAMLREISPGLFQIPLLHFSQVIVQASGVYISEDSFGRQYVEVTSTNIHIEISLPPTDQVIDSNADFHSDKSEAMTRLQKYFEYEYKDHQENNISCKERTAGFMRTLLYKYPRLSSQFCILRKRYSLVFTYEIQKQLDQDRFRW